MKILVTGFEPFGPWQRNPSGETARHLDGSTIIDAEITGLVLPVSFRRATAPSHSAGELLCNYIMYTTIHHITTHQLPSRAGFIHASPLREEAPDLTNRKGMRLKKWIHFTESVLYLLRNSV